MTREEALAKLISVRHHCFGKGIIGRNPDSDFRQAFRTVNRHYVELRDRLEATSGVSKPAAKRRRAA
jgi:hypothetical protein